MCAAINKANIRGKPRESIQQTTPKEESVLFALHNKEVYGRQIPQAIEEASGSQRSISEGALYPILRNLEKKGFVTSRWGESRPDNRGGARRRYYKLTDAGITQVRRVQQFHARLLEWQPT
ncbi:MAG: PadR family transcriptional regulator [Cyanobacteria bacterium J06627_3]